MGEYTENSIPTLFPTKPPKDAPKQRRRLLISHSLENENLGLELLFEAQQVFQESNTHDAVITESSSEEFL